LNVMWKFADWRGRNFILVSARPFGSVAHLRLDKPTVELTPLLNDSAFGAADEKAGGWLIGSRGTRFFCFESGELAKITRPLFSGGETPCLVPIDDARHVVASIENDGTFIASRRDSDTGIELRFGASVLPGTMTTSKSLQVDPNAGAPAI